VLLEHCYLPTLFSPFVLAASKVATLLIVESPATALPMSLRKWPTVTMLPGVARSNVQVLLQHWTLAVVELLSLFSSKLQQASPRLFQVYVPLGSWSIVPMLCALEQGVLPPLRTLQSFRPVGASAPVDQLRL